MHRLFMRIALLGFLLLSFQGLASASEEKKASASTRIIARKEQVLGEMKAFQTELESSVSVYEGSQQPVASMQLN